MKGVMKNNLFLKDLILFAMKYTGKKVSKPHMSQEIKIIISKERKKKYCWKKLMGRGRAGSF
jgi:hypothetical protein